MLWKSEMKLFELINFRATSNDIDIAMALQAASPELQNNVEVVIAAMQLNASWVFNFASDKMMNNLQFLFSFIQVPSLNYDEKYQKLHFRSDELSDIYRWIIFKALLHETVLNPLEYPLAYSHIPLQSLRTHLTITDVTYMKNTYPSIVNEILEAVLEEIQKIVPFEHIVRDVKGLRKHLNDLRRPCQAYADSLESFVKNVLIPENLDQYDSFWEIGKIHADCETKYSETFLPDAMSKKRKL